MKILIIAAHPNLEQSRVNKRWIEELKKQSNVTVNSIYNQYPDENIDIEREQKLLLEHDRIVLQFPFYWYSTPSLLKKWMDNVLTYGWAYGPEGNKLHGKELMVAVSTGGLGKAYEAGGYNHYTISELLKPIQATSNLIGTKYISPFKLHEANTISDEEIENSASDYAKYIFDAKVY